MTPRALEQQLIAILLWRNDSIIDVINYLAPDDFYDTECRSMFCAIIKLNETDTVSFNNVFDLCPATNSANYLDSANITGNALGLARKIKADAAQRKAQNILTKASQTKFENIDEIKKVVKEIQEIEAPVSQSAIIYPNDIMTDVLAMWDDPRENVFTTDIAGMDAYYNMLPGELCLVSGIPNMGKSEFLDQILVNAAKKYDWNFAYYSPENYHFKRHTRKLLSKYLHKPFNSDGRMNKQEIIDAADWMNSHFAWVHPSENETSLDCILDHFKYLITKRCTKGFVIDPWNWLEHRRGKDVTEVQYLSDSLTKVKRFCLDKDVLLWIVAHPRVLEKNAKGDYDPPSPYSINGGAMWRNKADNILCVHRVSMDDNAEENKVKILVQKIRNKQVVGQTGEIELFYNKHTGEYCGTKPEQSYQNNY